MAEQKPAEITRWITTFALCIFAACVLWMMNDLRREVKRSTQLLNEKLPQILEKSQTTAQTLADLSGDVRQLRDLAGVAGDGRDKTLVAFADTILDRIEKSNAVIGVEATFGSSLKDTVPASQWVRDGRKEALWLTFSADSRDDLVNRLCTTIWGADWYIQEPDGQPVKLKDWIHQMPPRQ